MAVKTLKINFWIFFSTINNHKLNFVNCKPVSVTTGPFSFLQAETYQKPTTNPRSLPPQSNTKNDKKLVKKVVIKFLGTSFKKHTAK